MNVEAGVARDSRACDGKLGLNGRVSRNIAERIPLLKGERLRKLLNVPNSLR